MKMEGISSWKSKEEEINMMDYESREREEGFGENRTSLKHKLTKTRQHEDRKKEIE